MSIAALNWAFSVPATGSRKSVLIALAWKAGDDGIAWPSTATLAELSGIAKRHVIRVLADLEEAGLVTIDRRNRATSAYTLHVDKSETGDTVSSGDVVSVGDKSAPSGDISAFPPPESGDKSALTGDTTSSNRQDRLVRKRKTDKQRARAAPDDAFDPWWDQYPRKVGKGQARRAYAAAAKKVSHEVLLAAVIAYPFDLSRPEYIPHASTWLNGERWADEIDTRDPVLVAVGYYDKDPPELDLSPPPRGVLVS